MKAIWLFLCLPLLVISCSAPSTSPPSNSSSQEETIKANLAKLDPADRKLAEEQKFCAVETEQRLGAMGPPKKVEINGEPVFLCCNQCKKTAEDKNEQGRVLAKAKELREKNGKQ